MPPRKFRASLPDMFYVLAGTEESLDVLRRYAAAGGNLSHMTRWVSQLRPDRLPSASRLERWRRSVGGLLRRAALPDRFGPWLQEVDVFLRVSLASPPRETVEATGCTLESLVAAVVCEEFGRRFPKRRPRAIREDALTLLKASAAGVFPAGTSLETFGKRVTRVPRREVLARHAEAFPASA